MMRTFITILLLLGVVLISKADNSANLLSSEEKLQMLNHIRTIRDHVAPSSESMKLVNWDEELEASSLKWISQCIVGPDPSLASVSGQTYLISEGALTYEKEELHSTSLIHDVSTNEVYRASSHPATSGFATDLTTILSDRVGCAIVNCPSIGQYWHCTWSSIQTSLARSNLEQQYIGCYNDDDAKHDLSDKTTGSMAHMTVEYCNEFCRGYTYAAVQYGTWCFCGDSYGKHGRANENDCNMACAGKPNQICGGNHRNSIYKVLNNTHSLLQSVDTVVASPIEQTLNDAEAGIVCSGTECSDELSSDIVGIAYSQDYIGCFVDDANRDVNAKNSGPVTAMTIEHCIEFCKEYTYAALQSSTWCFCGNMYGRLGKAPEEDCSMSCGGNKNQMCGGLWRNSIYKVPRSAQRDTNLIDSTISQSIDETSSTVVGVDLSQDYIGCYIDDGSRDLNAKNSGSVAEMTIEYCRDFCKGFEYAAVQLSTWCFCGDTYGRLGKAPEADCSMSCGGNPNQMCGGGWRNSIYKANPATEYIGCYIDDASRDLNVKNSGSVPAMTVEYCRDFCKGSKFAAVQYSTWCFCGDSFGRLGKAPEADCGMSCGGNKNQMCGGGWRNSIYKANPAPENPDQ